MKGIKIHDGGRSGTCTDNERHMNKVVTSILLCKKILRIFFYVL